MFTLAGGVVSWVLKLQTVVALSTTEAEYMAATQACKEAIWIQRLLEISGTNKRRLLCFVTVSYFTFRILLFFDKIRL